MQNVYAASLNRPQNAAASAIRRDAHISTGIAVLLASLRDWCRRKLPVCKLELLNNIAVADKVDVALPMGRGAVIVVVRRGPERRRDGLHNLAVASRLKLAQIVAVEQINLARFSSADTHMCHRARLIREQRESGRAHIDIVRRQILLVERCEVVADAQRSSIWRQLQE